MLRLSEFNATIKWQNGIHMHIADCMSRNSQPGEVDDDEVAKACVLVGEMFVTELNPGKRNSFSGEEASVVTSFRGSGLRSTSYAWRRGLNAADFGDLLHGSACW